MRKIYCIIILLFNAAITNAQHKKIDTLYVALNKANTDTARLQALFGLSRYYYIAYPDSAIIFAQQGYELSKKHNWIVNEGKSLNNIANAYATIGDYVNGMKYYLQSLRLHEGLNDLYGMATINNNIGATYIQEGDYNKAMPYLRKAEKNMAGYATTHKILTRDRKLNQIILENIGESYLDLHKIDSADHYLQINYAASKKDNFIDLLGAIERDLGEVQAARDNKSGALRYFRDAVKISVLNEDAENLSIAYLSIANLYHKFKLQDSAEYYAKKALESAGAGKFEQDVLNAGKVLYSFYDEDHNIPEAYKYYKLATAARDSIYSQDKVKQLLSLDFDEKQRQEDIANAQIEYQDKVRTYLFIAGLLILLLLVFVFWRNSRQRQKANRLLQKQKEDIQSALSQLQSTQAQLVQREKLASLGELTAGIAHEIQNPLNFVNNFSEVNIELMEEMETELISGDKDEALSIASDIKLNLEKIKYHGRRADGIVKGMLQHSRASSDVKELTDINKLADEYLRLAYHGLRAKDKSFNADLNTKFDPDAPLISVVPQDIGRVLLNLFTNAFYTVHQKKQTEGGNYKPGVTVITATDKKHLFIKVKDNGNGIPEAIREKIYQPFFTTKPTGEGTGLGLSMSYDIIKSHNGELEVESKEGEGATFIIKLPL